MRTLGGRTLARRRHPPLGSTISPAATPTPTPMPSPSPTLICCKASTLAMPTLAGLKTGAGTGAGGGAVLRAGPPSSRRRTRSFMTDPRCGFFQHVAAGLRQHCPAAYPVVIRTVWLPGNVEGTCSRRRSRFSIRVADRLDEKPPSKFCFTSGHMPAVGTTASTPARLPCPPATNWIQNSTNSPMGRNGVSPTRSCGGFSRGLFCAGKSDLPGRRSGDMAITTPQVIAAP